jgi:hypothetical protein
MRREKKLTGLFNNSKKSKKQLLNSRIIANILNVVGRTEKAPPVTPQINCTARRLILSFSTLLKINERHRNLCGAESHSGKRSPHRERGQGITFVNKNHKPNNSDNLL